MLMVFFVLIFQYFHLSTNSNLYEQHGVCNETWKTAGLANLVADARCFITKISSLTKPWFPPGFQNQVKAPNIHLFGTMTLICFIIHMAAILQ